MCGGENTFRLGLYTLAWPIFVEQLLRLLMNYVSVFMLGHYSDEAVAATGVASQILAISVIFYGFLTVGVQIVVAQLIGAKKFHRVEYVITNGLVVAFIIGVLMSFLFIFLGEGFLRALGLSERLVSVGAPFIQIIGGSSVIIALYSSVLPILRTHGYVRQAMVVPITVSVVNVILNYMFLYGPLHFLNMGVTGVGIASSIANIVGMALSVWLLNKYIGYRFRWQKLKQCSRKMLSSILQYGLPSAGENLSYAGSQLVVTAIIALLGTEALTTKIYASSISQFVALFAMSIGQASQIIIGRAIGARELDTAYRQGMRSWRIGLFIALLVSALLATFARPIMALFTPSETIIEMARVLFMYSILLELGRATNIIVISSLNSTGDVRFPFICGIIVMWIVSLPFSYVLGISAGLGLVGVWLAYIIDEGVRAALMYRRWQSRIWTTKSLF
ncbi:MATE family efflux transporter [Pseudocitrobacter faecalis]|uniref:MATE family efflux transporter n=1 Tax=Pseudocitrobacter faecalis TaxID=1398493 RepID=UPI0038999FA0